MPESVCPINMRGDQSMRIRLGVTKIDGLGRASRLRAEPGQASTGMYRKVKVRQSPCIPCVARVTDHLSGEDILSFDDLDAALCQMRIQSESAIRMTYRDEIGAGTVAVLAPVVGDHHGALTRSKDRRTNVHLEVVAVIPESRMAVP